MTKSKEGLKECPCCKSDCIVWLHDCEHTGDNHCVECQECGLTTKMFRFKEQAIQAWNTRNLVEIDEEEVSNALYDIDFLCEDCGGQGYLGHAKDGRKISCENCGGHEDSLGRGYDIDIVAKAITKKIGQTKPKLCKCHNDEEGSMTVMRVNDDFHKCPRCGGLIPTVQLPLRDVKWPEIDDATMQMPPEQVWDVCVDACIKAYEPAQPINEEE